MIRHASLFSQLTGLFNRNQFHALVLHHGSEKHAKGFSSWDHFVAMLFCQMPQGHILVEDRAYVDLTWLKNWHGNKQFFVNRLKKNFK
ncbi:DUF4372 domain-containing protein [Desulfatibacillum aliphaticivorans]|uniref:DUF4372 domain-containing protein n=1 Tax=Desulfatibacillum aliphaticivorans TaxID=218208 RepID=UPI0003FB54EE|nr:DUF4372 domain-containing protein [Desulfatibacillum aliphaticivorans]